MTYLPLDIRMIEIFGKKKLTFGCIIKYGDAYMKYSHEGASYFIFVDSKGTGAIEKSSKDKIEILGHPPTLEDIFRVADEEQYYCNAYLGRLHIFKPYGGGPISSSGPRTKSLDCDYQTERSPLSQSEETKQALVDLFS